MRIHLTVLAALCGVAIALAPHGTAKLQTDGKIWDVVLAPTSRMQTRGLTEAMLAKGTKAKVLGYQHKQHATEMRAERITIDGKTVELR